MIVKEANPAIWRETRQAEESFDGNLEDWRTMSSLVPLVPLVGPLATAAVAVVAIVVSRRSNQVNVRKDIELKKWEKRAESYLDMLTMIERQSPSHAPTILDVISSAETEKAQITAVDLHGDEWHSFDVRVRLYSSPNVATLYFVWKLTFSEWTKCRASLIVNHGRWDQSTTTEKEAIERELAVRHRLELLQRELLLHVRSEIDFRERRLPRIERTSTNSAFIELPDETLSSDLEVFVGHDPDYMTDVLRGDGGWHVDVRLSTGSRAEDMVNAERLTDRTESE